MKMSKCKKLFTFLLAVMTFAACTNSNDTSVPLKFGTVKNL